MTVLCVTLTIHILFNCSIRWIKNLQADENITELYPYLMYSIAWSPWAQEHEHWMNEWTFQESTSMPSVKYQRNIKYLYSIASKRHWGTHKKTETELKTKETWSQLLLVLLKVAWTLWWIRVWNSPKEQRNENNCYRFYYSCVHHFCSPFLFFLSCSHCDCLNESFFFSESNI